MNLPFTHEAFLDVFGAYNATSWPVVVLLWAATAWIALSWLLGRSVSGRSIHVLLAAHWAWSGVVYHWMFFRPINPVAVGFGALFVLQAVLFAWLALRPRGSYTVDGDLRRILAVAFVVYGLVYPLVGLGFGLEYPRMPVFAVPCPTTLVTTGFLLSVSGTPRFLKVVPVLWAVIGGLAAFALGIRADLALVAAAVVLGVDMLAPTLLGGRPALSRVA